jgi:hypothetical protein
MKNHNIQYHTILLALTFALASIAQANQHPDGGPTHLKTTTTVSPRANPTSRPAPIATSRPGAVADAESSADAESAEDAEFPVLNIHSTGNVYRGKIGSFVLTMKPQVMLGGMFVNFKVSGTAVQGVDYAALISPAYIGQSGYGVILLKTFADLRGSGMRQTYSVVVTLEPGVGYALGESKSAEIMIK